MSNQQIPLFSAQLANANLDFVTPLKNVLDSHWYILGSQVKDFEQEFAAYVGVKHCIGVANGSEALELALRGLGLGVGSKVVTVANAGFYGSTAIHAIGGTPLYVDIARESMTMCPRALSGVINDGVAAVIVTHLYGQLANIEEVVAIASAAGVPVIEDCAQSHGARSGTHLAGSFGTLACFSFYPTKNLGALGDGGAVVTNDDDLAARIRKLGQYGWTKKYEVSIPGGRNSRLDEMQAAILRVKLPHLDSWNEQRRNIASRYQAAFSSFDMVLPSSTGDDYVAHLYVVRVKNRLAFMNFLRDRHVTTDIHYPIADHNQPAYSSEAEFDLMETEAACESVVTLPCFPGLTSAEVESVIAAVTDFFLQEK